MMENSLVKKIAAYITRRKNDQLELLIFEHVDYPEAGLQIPAGGVEVGEDLLTALRREIWEEAGLNQFASIRKLGITLFEVPERGETHERHFFQVELAEETPTPFDHRVSGSGGDKGMLFRYHWAPVAASLDLAVELDAWLEAVS